MTTRAREERAGVLIAIQELINEYEHGIWSSGNLT